MTARLWLSAAVISCLGATACTKDGEPAAPAASPDTVGGTDLVASTDLGQTDTAAADAALADAPPVPDTAPADTSPPPPDVPDAQTPPDTVAPPDAGPTIAAGLRIEPATARACQLRLTDPSRRLKQVVFAASLEGRQVRRGNRVGIAFFRLGDAPIEDGPVALSLSGGSPADVPLSKVTCFDKAGEPLPGAKVTVTP